MNDKELSQLLEFLGLSWQGYRKVRKGVKKRVCRHMQSLDCLSRREYIEQLERSAKDKSQCELALTVPISRFFRDRKLWEALENQFLPELTAAGKGRARVWCAGKKGTSYIPPVKSILLIYDYEGLRTLSIFENTPRACFQIFSSADALA